MVHALLFAEGSGLKFTTLQKTLQCTESELHEALATLSRHLHQSGVCVITTENEASLAIEEGEASFIIDRERAELQKDIGDAGLEVLAILLYEGPASRSRIDYIRGVNSSSTIRNLLIRGLLERTGNPADSREYLYRPTTELYAHLGMTTQHELPEYATIAAELAAFTAPNAPSNASDANTSDSA